MAAIKKYNGGTWETTTARKYENKTEIIVPPTTIYADGTAATLSIKGNTVQNGTPTPSNPVSVNGVGVRTENLFDGSYTDGYIGGDTGTRYSTSSEAKTAIVKCEPNTTYTIKKITSSNRFTIATSASYPQDSEIVNVLINSPAETTATITTPADASYLLIYVSTSSEQATPDMMLNTGSTAKPFEPYGYKIPILSGGVTTNIYLSEPLYKIGEYADTINSNGTVTRKIKKIIFNGTENWSGDNTKTHYLQDIIMNYPHETKLICCCSHFNGVTNVQIGSSIPDGAVTFLVEMDVLYLKGFEVSTLSDFKQFLADQYAAGTPVTLWYVLATAESESITAPTIPTTDGANSITVDTTVQPSEFTATWTGWHDANVKEWNGSQWIE